MGRQRNGNIFHAWFFAYRLRPELQWIQMPVFRFREARREPDQLSTHNGERT
jgi:hypothetical protein